VSRGYGPPGLGFLSYGPLFLRFESPQCLLPLPAVDGKRIADHTPSIQRQAGPFAEWII
jgi:hypothetical protein